ncbi:MAG: DNA polymerase III subunit gamma/tau [Pseudomonadales bacterium]
MSYEVLARKYRPARFDEMVGQEHVRRSLVHALEHDRLHHAYLFSGTRGVGKTSVARIFAKCLNCEEGVSATPCGVCTSCTEIAEGRFIDLLEVDAASRTGVDDTRELLENVQYAPARGRYKVYLIDEVHMLSRQSFNALLKTLEEPPPHVKFLLATTDPKKIPLTVLSRCLQFNLKNLLPELIVGHLDNVLRQEGIVCEEGALLPIARAARGSVRDALSLADQAIAHGGGSLARDQVIQMLGTVGGEELAAIFNALTESDGGSLLAVAHGLAERGTDFEQVLAGLLQVLYEVAVKQSVADADESYFEHPELVATIASRVPAETVQLYYQIVLLANRDLPLAPDPRIGFEMTLLRLLAFRPDSAAASSGGAGSAGPSEAPDKAAKEATKTPPRRPEDKSVAIQWHALVPQLGLSGVALGLADHAVGYEDGPGRYRLVLDPTHATLLNDQQIERIRSALETYAGTQVHLTVETAQPQEETPAARRERIEHERMEAARQSIENDSTVRSLIEEFGAQVDRDSIQPLDTGV